MTIPPSNNRKRKRLGKPLTRTDEQLEALSVVTPADIEAARVLVRSAAPGLAKLMEAEQIEEHAQAKPAE
jgi:hypothetical protein